MTIDYGASQRLRLPNGQVQRHFRKTGEESREKTAKMGQAEAQEAQVKAQEAQVGAQVAGGQ